MGCWREAQHLIEAHSAAKAGAAAFQAAPRGEDAGRAFGGEGLDEQPPGFCICGFLRLAVGAEGAHQPLRHHAQHRRPNHVGGDAQIQQAGDGGRGIAGVQGGKHQMAGQGRLHGHFRGLQIADFADHQNIRVLAQQGRDGGGEVEADAGLHLQLIERRLDHLDGVFNGADIHLGAGQLLQSGIQGGGLAGAGGASHQQDAAGGPGHVLPALPVLAVQAQLREAAQQHLRGEDARHQLLAERRGQGG